MECIPTNRLLKFRPNQLEHVRKQYNFENPEDMSRAVDVLEDWIKNQKHFMKKDLPKQYLEKIIISSKGSIERTKSKIDNLCTFRTGMPEFFGENLIKNKFEDLIGIELAIAPEPTSENHRVCFIRVTQSPHSYSQILNFYRCMILVCEYLLANDCNDGVILIVDYFKANILEIIQFLNLAQLRQVLEILMNGYGMRVKGIHFLTTSKAIDALLTILKQFLSSKLGKRLLVHKEISAVYQYVPMDILPGDYGGKEKSIKELFDGLIDEITGQDFVNYMEEMNKAKTDESCRPTDSFNEQHLGIPGSFRTLSVD